MSRPRSAMHACLVCVKQAAAEEPPPHSIDLLSVAFYSPIAAMTVACGIHHLGGWFVCSASAL
jgi:hypothetical protein